MSKVNGQLRICDRCGSEIFLKCTGEGNTDGGYTRWNEFEKAVGWNYLSTIGDLCPKCWDEYQERRKTFDAELKSAKFIK